MIPSSFKAGDQGLSPTLGGGTGEDPHQSLPEGGRHQKVLTSMWPPRRPKDSSGSMPSHQVCGASTRGQCTRRPGIVASLERSRLGRGQSRTRTQWKADQLRLPTQPMTATPCHPHDRGTTHLHTHRHNLPPTLCRAPPTGGAALGAEALHVRWSRHLYR